MFLKLPPSSFGMNIAQFKSEYEKLVKKHKLPSFEELDKEFELLYIRDFIEINFPLKFIRRRIVDKIVVYCSMIQSLIQPNPSSPISLQESKFFKEEDLKRMVDILKELMFFERASFSLDTDSTEEKDALFIKDALVLWKKLKKELAGIATSLKEGWKKQVSSESKDKNHYFG